MAAETDVVIAQDLVRLFPGRTKNTPEVRALDSLTMNIRAGELTALVGPDGAGKTTFQRLIAGLYAPSSGSLTVLGTDVSTDPQAVQNRISYMPQRFGLYDDLSVQENLDLYADLHGVDQQTRKERFERLLTITDLTRFTDRPAGKLSGGMKQKLGLACTLVRSPDLLLLDEPSVGVDPLSRRDLWKIIEQLVQDEQLSVIISTAYMDEAERCAQVYVMYQGRILAQGTPDELRKKADGLTWQATPPDGMKARSLQARLLENRQHVIDAVPKGDTVRFICQSDSDESLARGHHATRRDAELEDGFMVLLHQAQHQDEQVASRPVKADMVSAQESAETENKPVIVVRDLVRKFGDFTAVASTSFEVRRGEIFGLLGPNGAGKTTTFRMLCGLLPATSGHLEVAGMNLRTARAKARARIGYVSQKFALYGNLTVRENLTFFGGAYGLSGKHLAQQIETSLAQFSLDPDAISVELPGGFKQRLSMAAALLHEPEIVFLDEPTSGIDPLARRAFWYTIGELANKGITVIVTTHFMEEAEYCDRIAIQDAGKMLALGTPREVRQKAGLEHAADMNTAFIAIVENARAKEHKKEAKA
ncbi:ATP-binding cassette domain-containing protein [Citrobacter portucalensis]|uniref:ABC transporter ATP-binding protein n=2 Tax=Enterobacterales TaxID=91347 RepID=A0A5V6M4V7_SALET|nr:ATP-binding cassette domain-containing protein [Obesumbacterium proteus]EAZ5200871.1 ABC transporter ATP-binding protein [Salmonella enterica]EBU7984346.1 ABC transporter ATP-binding protein [Salmonella enterica subsp. enterica serovar Agona]ECZ9067985.1 ABC transporter ATP-binding protein [Salmonella enterica subsp. enterica serovar Derby]EKN4012788.1 ABC transporter ATP-binding protein [Yersinia enterocolitica]EBR6979911.1 ABC transporter ATP-binding protein [Salmonella enterica]